MKKYIKRLIQTPVLFGVVVVSFLLIVTYIGWIMYTTYFGVNDVINKPMERKAQQYYDDVRGNKLADNATAEQKLEHYRKLAGAAEVNRDYKTAVDAAEQALQVAGDKATTYEYLYKARYQCRADDREGALSTLNRLIDSKKTDQEAIDSATYVKDAITKEGCQGWLRRFDSQ